MCSGAGFLFFIKCNNIPILVLLGCLLIIPELKVMANFMNPYQEYENNEINTAEPKELILMLYTGALGFLEEALKYIDDYKSYDKANEKLLRAQDIITELILSLDMNKGGDVAKNLFNLYTYMKKELLNANIKKEKSPIQSVIKYLKELKEAWEKADIQKGEKPPSRPDIQDNPDTFAVQG